MKAPGCEGHDHPQLSYPIEEAQHVEEFNDALEAARSIEPTIGATMRFSNKLDHTHRRHPRQYAETVYKEGQLSEVRFAPQTLWLPAKYRDGLIMHELGHVSLGNTDHTEQQADEEGARLSGDMIYIAYDNQWPGRGLQVALSDEDFDDDPFDDQFDDEPPNDDDFYDPI